MTCSTLATGSRRDGGPSRHATSRCHGVRAVLLASVIATAAGCGRAPEPAQPATPAPPFVPTATIKDLMLSIIDPSADVVWLSVTTVQNATGTVETRPQNDEDWERVKHGAFQLVEAANLLMIPGRRVAPPGDKSVAPGVELEPEEMQVMIDKDPDGWNMRATALHTAALQTLEAVKSHDADKVFELGEQIEHACEGCHRAYWYPNEVIPELPSVP